jgi:hypothetical protein
VADILCPKRASDWDWDVAALWVRWALWVVGATSDDMGHAACSRGAGGGVQQAGSVMDHPHNSRPRPWGASLTLDPKLSAQWLCHVLCAVCSVGSSSAT